MQFLKALFWFLILGLMAAFAATNWQPVEIQLWSGLVADVNLPALLVAMFLLGLIPTMLVYHAVRWRLRQRIATLERTLEDLRAAHAATGPTEPATPEPAAPDPAAVEPEPAADLLGEIPVPAPSAPSLVTR